MGGLWMKGRFLVMSGRDKPGNISPWISPSTSSQPLC